MPPLAITDTPRPRSPATAAAVGMPQSANSSPRARSSPSARRASTLTQDVPPAPETSIVRTPTSRSRWRDGSREMPQPVSLATTGTGSSPHQAGEGREAAAEVAVAPGLDQLLPGVQVDAERVRADVRRPGFATSAVGVETACTCPRFASTSVVGACARTVNV